MTTDLYRNLISTSSALGLSTLVLWIVFERMVRMASRFCGAKSPDDKPIYLPVMPRIGERDEGRLEIEHAVGGISESQSR